MAVDWVTVAQLSKADADLQETLAASTSQRVQAAYDGIDWYDHDAITAAATTAGTVVHAAAQTSVGMTAAYLTRALREMSAGTPTVGTARIVGPLRTGVASWSTVYGRVADTVRFEVSKGKTVQDAVAVGLERADAMSRTDLALARRAQARRSLETSPRVVGYRRVVHPELSRGGSCGLCIAAADRRYNRGDLMPLHQRCKCTVLPLTAAHDPGGAFDLDPAFEEAYAVSLSNRAADLKEVRMRVEEHGELGPVLTNAAHRSRTPGRNRQARAARGQDPLRRPDTASASRADTLADFATR